MSWIREQIVKPLTRSPGWRKVRKQYVVENPTCECCNRKKSWRKYMQVHHIQDFSTAPHLELDPTNLMTMCARCHLVFGHLGDWQSINPTVITDAWHYSDQRDARRKRKK